jgi:hypothetical protein
LASCEAPATTARCTATGPGESADDEALRPDENPCTRAGPAAAAAANASALARPSTAAVPASARLSAAAARSAAVARPAKAPALRKAAEPAIPALPSDTDRGGPDPGAPDPPEPTDPAHSPGPPARRGGLGMSGPQSSAN